MPWVIGLAAGFGSAFAKPLTELVLTKAVQLTAGEECVNCNSIITALMEETKNRVAHSLWHKTAPSLHRQDCIEEDGQPAIADVHIHTNINYTQDGKVRHHL